MHKQFRVVPISSPPDVEKLLRRLKDAKVNLAGAGGSNVEFGGEFAFAVDDGQEDRTIEVLDRHHYPYRVYEYKVNPELTLCWLENTPGSLHACIARVAADNLETGRIIRDVLIGVPGKEGVPAQVFSEQVRTPLTVDRDDTGAWPAGT
jgi:hypothetical protein